MDQIDTTNVKLTPLEQFIKDEQHAMLKHLKTLVLDCKRSIRIDPSLYLDMDHDEPSIDVRLCIDRFETNSNPFSLCSPLEERFEWSFKIGDVQYDTSHSAHCGAGAIGLDSDALDLLTDMVAEILI